MSLVQCTRVILLNSCTFSAFVYSSRPTVWCINMNGASKAMIQCKAAFIATLTELRCASYIQDMHFRTQWALKRLIAYFIRTVFVSCDFFFTTFALSLYTIASSLVLCAFFIYSLYVRSSLLCQFSKRYRYAMKRENQVMNSFSLEC